MSGAQIAGAVVAGLGVLVCVASAVGAALARDVLARLHYLTPVTSVGGPLIGVGLVIGTGWSLAGAMVLLTVLVLAVTGPVLASATANVAREDEP